MNKRIILLITIGFSAFACFGAIWYDLALSSVSNERLSEAINVASTKLSDAAINMPADYPQTMMTIMRNMIEHSRYHMLFCILEFIGLGIMITPNARIGFHIYAASQLGIGWLSYKVFGDSCFLFVISCAFMVFIYYKLTHSKSESK